MRSLEGVKILFAASLTVGGLLLWPAAARSDCTNLLVPEVAAYLNDCKPAQATALTFPQTCYNRRADLVHKMYDSHMSADDVNRCLATRGNSHGGFDPKVP
jgi:hypothetical protein